jgi:DNA-binding PadR family transcriptional regulator
MERTLLLLGVLRAQKMHGYQLNDFLERHYDFVTDLKPSTAYYLLDKLAADGFVTMHQEQVGNRPPRRVYEITRSGEEHYLELLRANLATRGSPVYSDEVGLAFVQDLPVQEVHAALVQKLAAWRAEYERLAEVAPRMGDKAGGAALTLNHHLHMIAAEVSWLEMHQDVETPVIATAQP